ncbi:MAG: hypothetical protein ACD_80C00149G0005 [uncultured bacterium (gcode 4)]|uniref:ATP synthase epsilon chain n=1 Tax=uncultured bacterium (gcode 4) TaxID=1234023 RepID=K1YHG5_9BACT|nr:MAG: hypothetical protein ACD_80C00149G0005 [uncultured bacterium (gcode 4)]
MFLKIISPSSVIYHGEVLKVIIPTAAWEIGILPHHIPLTSIITPWLVKFLPKEKHAEAFVQWATFLFEDDMITISVGKWLLYLDGETVELLINTATTHAVSDKALLEKMKADQEKEIELIKLKGDINEIEKAYLSLQQITADLKLHKMKYKK